MLLMIAVRLYVYPGGHKYQSLSFKTSEVRSVTSKRGQRAWVARLPLLH